MAALQLSEGQREAFWEVIKKLVHDCGNMTASLFSEACELAPLLGHSAAELDEEFQGSLLVIPEHDDPSKVCVRDVALLNQLELLGIRPRVFE